MPRKSAEDALINTHNKMSLKFEAQDGTNIF